MSLQARLQEQTSLFLNKTLLKNIFSRPELLLSNAMLLCKLYAEADRENTEEPNSFNSVIGHDRSPGLLYVIGLSDKLFLLSEE
ncbi:MAG: hypothetical protein HC878_09915 [Leptolyngbyaceae cyanobacterium SL_5_14]|nr:hypothetical protein [Leptolyngbyaceae cyanobacterium SL_5_14]